VEEENQGEPADSGCPEKQPLKIDGWWWWW